MHRWLRCRQKQRAVVCGCITQVRSHGHAVVYLRSLVKVHVHHTVGHFRAFCQSLLGVCTTHASDVALASYILVIIHLPCTAVCSYLTYVYKGWKYDYCTSCSQMPLCIALPHMLQKLPMVYTVQCTYRSTDVHIQIDVHTSWLGVTFADRACMRVAMSLESSSLSRHSSDIQ